jgi:hypothetical protein
VRVRVYVEIMSSGCAEVEVPDGSSLQQQKDLVYCKLTENPYMVEEDPSERELIGFQIEGDPDEELVDL